MTEKELKIEAEKLGYKIIRKPCYQCSCYAEYPNKAHKFKNGNWKCVDKFKPIKHKRINNFSPVTKCVMIEKEKNETDS